MTLTISSAHCARLHGLGVRDCVCWMLPHDRERGGGFAECPPEARGELFLDPADAGKTLHAMTIPEPAGYDRRSPAYSGDICADCGGAQMVRTGTCLTCQDCGSSSGGCS